MRKFQATSRLRPLLIAVLATAVVAASGVTFAQEGGTRKDRGPLKVTYVGNAGFLIETENHKVLIDALYRSGTERYVPIPDSQRDVLEGAKPPFDGVDVVLVTHVHRDHFEPSSVGNYLMNNQEAMLFTTAETVQRLQLAFRDFEQIESRVGGVLPQERAWDFEHNGIKVKAFRLVHVEDRTTNFAFVVSMDGWKFVHTGDGVGSMNEFRKNGLHTDDIDIAFLPFYYVSDIMLLEAISKGINADNVILMHMPDKNKKDSILDSFGGWDQVLATAREKAPSAMAFEKQMDTRVFR